MLTTNFEDLTYILSSERSLFWSWWCAKKVKRKQFQFQFMSKAIICVISKVWCQRLVYFVRLSEFNIWFELLKLSTPKMKILHSTMCTARSRCASSLLSSCTAACSASSSAARAPPLPAPCQRSRFPTSAAAARSSSAWSASSSPAHQQLLTNCLQETWKIWKAVIGRSIQTYGLVVKASSSESDNMGSNPAGCWKSLELLGHFVWNWTCHWTDFYIAVPAIIFFLNFVRAQSESEELLMMLQNASPGRLLLDWGTLSGRVCECISLCGLKMCSNSTPLFNLTLLALLACGALWRARKAVLELLLWSPAAALTLALYVTVTIWPALPCRPVPRGQPILPFSAGLMAHQTPLPGSVCFAGQVAQL